MIDEKRWSVFCVSLLVLSGRADAVRNNPDERCTSPTKCLFLWFLHQIRMISRRTSPPYMFICSRRNAFHPSTYTTCSMATCTPRPPTLAANRCDAVSGECTKVRITECRVSTLHDEKSLISIPTPRGRDHDRQHNMPYRPAWPPLHDHETPRAVRPLIRTQS